MDEFSRRNAFQKYWQDKGTFCENQFASKKEIASLAWNEAISLCEKEKMISSFDFDPQDKVTFEKQVKIDRLKKELDDVWLILHNMTEKNIELKKAIVTMLEQFGRYEDEYNKATFEHARLVL